VVERGAMRINTADLQGPKGFGILGTARMSHGTPALDLKPDSVVEYQGMTMKLAQAEQLGLVKRDAHGGYSEILPEERAARQQAAERRAHGRQSPPTEAADVNGMEQEPFSPELEAGLAKLTAGVPPQLVNQVLMEAALMTAETGNLGKLSVESVVSKTGMSPEAAAQFMEATLVALQGQADRVLLQRQIDPAQFYDWARRERLEQLRQAVVQHAGVRTLAGYRALAKDFIRNTTPDAEGLSKAGYQTRVDPTSGKLLVLYNGVWMEARAAAIQGLI
jgi:hypothetical protein